MTGTGCCYPSLVTAQSSAVTTIYKLDNQATAAWHHWNKVQYFSLSACDKLDDWDNGYATTVDIGLPPATLRLDLDGERAVIGSAARTFQMPDGSLIRVDAQGNYQIEDTDAKVIYRGNRIREFNRYVNASDLLAEFIRYVGSVGLRQQDVPTLPIGLFVNWLILSAAEADEEPAPPDVLPIPRQPLLLERVRPRCLCCARFVSRKLASAGFAFVNAGHAARYHTKLLATG